MTRNVYIGTFVLLVGVAFLVNCGHPLDSDEGVTLTGAWNMLNGRRLYVDFFQYEAPGAYVFTWLSFVLLGAHYWSAKALALLLLAGSGVAVAFVAQQVGASGRSCCGAALAWVVFASVPGIFVNHNPLSAFVAAIALASVVHAYRAPAHWFRWLIAGLLTGLVPIFHQSKGLLFAGAIGISLVVLSSRTKVRPMSVVALLGAMAVPTAAACLAWGPSLLYERVVAWPSQHYLQVGPVGPAPFVGAAMVFAVLGVAGWKSGADRGTLSLVLVAQSALLLSSLSRSDVDHLVLNVFPCFALGALAFDRMRADARGRWAAAVWGVLGLVMVARVVSNVSMSAARRAILGTLRSHGVARFYAEPFVPQLYFELRAENPYPFSHLLTGMHTEDQFAANATVLARERPPFVLRNRSIVEKFQYDWSNALDRWIDEHYTQVGESGNLEILAWGSVPEHSAIRK